MSAAGTVLTVALLAAALYFVWRRPQRGLLLTAALTPFNGLLILLPDGTVPAWWKEALLALTLLCALARARRDELPRMNIPWWPAVVALVVIGVVSAVIAFGALAYLPVKITFFYAIIIVIAWLAPLTASDRDHLVTILMVAGIINAAYGIAQQALGVDTLVAMGYEYGQQVRNAGDLLRSFGTFHQPFPYGLFLMITILVGSAVALAEPRRLRNRIFFWCIPLLLVGQALSVVRASYLGLALGLLTLGIIRYRKLLYGLGIGAVLGVPLALVAVPPATLSTVLSSDSYNTRASGWETTWDSILENPFGQGLGASGSAAEKLVSGSVQLPESLRARIDGDTAYAFGIPYQPDNYYLKLLIELGPIGLWLFVVFLVVVLASAVSTCREATTSVDAGLAAGIGSMVVAAAAASSVSTYLEIFPLDVYTWLFVAVLAGIPRRSPPESGTADARIPSHPASDEMTMQP